MIMKKMFLFICIGLGVMSCQKDNIQPNDPPLPPQPIVYDTIVMDTALNMVGESWVITGYRVSEIGSIIPTNDTLAFNTINQYTFNGNGATYSFYTTASAYNLTMNYTPWGNLSGTIYDGNINNGVINGLKFVDVTMGSSNQTNYYLWMHKI
jgi:hypothetical protein